MDSRQLSYLRAVIDHGSFTAAAKALFLTQPSLSTAIRNLEEELGTTLLIRSRSGVSATETGRELYRLASDVLVQMEATRNTIIGMAGGVTGKLTINIAPEYNWAYLPPLLLNIRDALPEVELTVADPEPLNTLDNIRQGRADIGIMPTSDLPRLRTTHPDLVFEDLLALSLRIGLAPGHPAATEATVGGLHMADLRGDDWLMPTPHPEFPGLPESLQRFWAQHPESRPARIHQISTLQTALPLIAGGVGVGVLPEFTTALSESAIIYRPILDDLKTLNLVMLRRSHPRPSPVVQRVQEMIREHAHKASRV